MLYSTKNVFYNLYLLLNRCYLFQKQAFITNQINIFVLLNKKLRQTIILTLIL